MNHALSSFILQEVSRTNLTSVATGALDALAKVPASANGGGNGDVATIVLAELVIARQIRTLQVVTVPPTVERPFPLAFFACESPPYDRAVHGDVRRRPSQPATTIEHSDGEADDESVQQSRPIDRIVVPVSSSAVLTLADWTRIVEDAVAATPNAAADATIAIVGSDSSVSFYALGIPADGWQADHVNIDLSVANEWTITAAEELDVSVPGDIVRKADMPTV